MTAERTVCEMTRLDNGLREQGPKKQANDLSRLRLALFQEHRQFVRSMAIFESSSLNEALCQHVQIEPMVY